MRVIRDLTVVLLTLGSPTIALADACDEALSCVDICKTYAIGKGKSCVYDKHGSEPSSMVEAECTSLFQSTLLYCAQTCVQKYGKC